MIRCALQCAMSLLAGGLMAGCITAAPVGGGGTIIDPNGWALTSTVGPLAAQGWPKPAGREVALIRYDRSECLAISAIYPESDHACRMLLIGPGGRWSLGLGTTRLPSDGIAFLFFYEGLVLHVTEALMSAGPEPQSLMDPATRAVIERLRAHETVPVEAIAVGNEMLTGTLTWHPTTRPASPSD